MTMTSRLEPDLAGSRPHKVAVVRDADVTARTLRLLTLLQARPRWPAGELAVRLDAAPRTLRRDLQRLRSLGYEITGRPGPGGHYELRSGTRLPPLVFDDEEVIVLVTALRAAEQGPSAEVASRALVKLQRVVPRSLAARIEAFAAHSEAVRLDAAAPPNSLVALTAAAAGDQLIGFVYTDPAGGSGPRRVDSARCVALRDRWYLLAFDLDRDDWRTFRLDRISAVDHRGRVPRRSLPDDDLARWFSTDFGRSPRR